MSGSLLSRVSIFRSSSDLTPLQSQVDSQVGGFVQQATDWKSLAALSTGSVSYRLGRMGLMGFGSGHVVRALSIGAGLATEVSTFEATNRFLGSSSAPNKNLWQWSGQGGLQQGLLSSLVTFSTLKGFERLAQGQNILLKHGAQDAAMVLGHQLVYRAGIGPKPEGTLAEQFLRAEATNLQLGAGMALAGGVLPRLQALEKGMDLSLTRLKDSPTDHKESGLPFAWALAGPGTVPSKPSPSASKDFLVDLHSAMASLGGGLRRKDFPYSAHKVFEKDGTSLDIKLLSRKPIADKERAVLELAEEFLNMLAVGLEETSLMGPVADRLKASPELRGFLLGPLKKVFLWVDLDGAEILTLRVFKDDVRVEFSVPQAALVLRPTSTELLQGSAFLKALNLPLSSLGLSTRAALGLAKALPKNVGTIYLGHVVQLTEGELSKRRNIGIQTITEIKEALASRGLALGLEGSWRTPEDAFGQPVENLGPSERVKNILAWHGIKYIGQLVQKTPAELRKAPNVGKERVKEIEQILEPWGLSLGMSTPWKVSEISLGMSVDDLRFSQGIRRLFQDLNIKTVHDLVQRSQASLFVGDYLMRGFEVKEIKDTLARMGLCLKGDPLAFVRQEVREKLDEPIQILGLSPKTAAVLEREGLGYLGDLARQSSSGFLKLRGIGRKSYREVKEALGKFGLSFDMGLYGWRNPRERELYGPL